MRVTLELFGWTFDWTAAPTGAEDEAADDKARDLSLLHQRINALLDDLETLGWER